MCTLQQKEFFSQTLLQGKMCEVRGWSFQQVWVQSYPTDGHGAGLPKNESVPNRRRTVPNPNRLGSKPAQTANRWRSERKSDDPWNRWKEPTRRTANRVTILLINHFFIILFSFFLVNIFITIDKQLISTIIIIGTSTLL